MVKHALKENVAHLVSLWHSYGGVVKKEGIYRHEQWPHKAWSVDQEINESVSSLRLNRTNTPLGWKYFTFDSEQPREAVSSLVAMHKSITDVKDIFEDASIKEVVSEKELAEWVTLGSEGFGYQIDISPILRVFSQARSRLYFIMSDEIAVGTVMTWTEGRDVGIHQMAITQAGRGKGLAGKALVQLERIARFHGAQTLSLQASKKGFKIYAGAGFSPLGYISSYL
ncbi:hypothetical protein PCIT_b0599 [Pseudoalteromonas citrea]|uniref:N-acetyltransferase domain-containing protein n=2 Tax=Pseudoalteromonas citrea TaxID=43655 RepID=A0AAD4AEU6_9GAMM|nr:GNAT family N-acetyltransferase [Pseudoalteromonas citrea]KAF7764563.1 hypothetical protein PCIT_b0599 [Pseudoalteromonas citrea]